MILFGRIDDEACITCSTVNRTITFTKLCIQLEVEMCSSQYCSEDPKEPVFCVTGDDQEIPEASTPGYNEEKGSTASSIGWAATGSFAIITAVLIIMYLRKYGAVNCCCHGYPCRGCNDAQSRRIIIET